MSEENSPFRENGDEPLGRSSTIHLPMADSPDASKYRQSEILPESIPVDDLVSGDASAEIYSNAISIDDKESNKLLDEPKVSKS